MLICSLFTLETHIDCLFLRQSKVSHSKLVRFQMSQPKRWLLGRARDIAYRKYRCIICDVANRIADIFANTYNVAHFVAYLACLRVFGLGWVVVRSLGSKIESALQARRIFRYSAYNIRRIILCTNDKALNLFLIVNITRI